MKKQNSLKSDATLPIIDDFHSNEDWQFERPAWDTEKCIRCGVCYLSCPDGAIFQNEEGYYEADPKFCKGCGICKQQCWTGCIAMEMYTEQPPWLVLVRKMTS